MFKRCQIRLQLTLITTVLSKEEMHAFGFPPPLNMQRDLERGGSSFWREGSDGPIAEEVENTCIYPEFYRCSFRERVI